MPKIQRYYTLDAQANALLRAAFDARTANVQKARRYVKKHFGVNDCVMMESSTKGIEVLGVASETSPGPDWKQPKNKKKEGKFFFWYPKRTKLGREIQQRLNCFNLDYLAEFRTLIGFGEPCWEHIEDFRFFTGGFSLTNVGPCEWLLTLHEADTRTPLHANRIPDIEFEQKVLEFEKSQPKKKAKK